MKQFSQYGCLPVHGLTVANTHGDLCPEFNQQTLAYITGNAEIDTCILIARWPMYLDGSRFDNEEGGHSGIDDGFARSATSASLAIHGGWMPFTLNSGRKFPLWWLPANMS